MNQNTPEKDNLRKYLLGNLDSEIKGKVEDDFMTDDSVFQELEIQEDELIQDYVNKRLNAEEEKLFHKNFLISEERKENLEFTQALRQYADENNYEEGAKGNSPVKNKKTAYFFGKFSSLSLAGAGGFVMILLAAGIIWKVFFQSAKPDETLIALNKAYQKERPFESRISGFDHAPIKNLRGTEKKEFDEISRDRAKILSSDAFENSKTAETFHSLGRVYLSEKSFDTAIEKLKKALELAPQDAEIISDLGTAYLEKGKTFSTEKNGKSFDLYAQALEEFEKALIIDPKSQTAQFNKAGCLQALKQTHQAEEAWQNYLKLDDKSPWADEARRNLQLLQSENSQSKTKDEILKDFIEAFERDDRTKAWEIISRNREMITGKLVFQQLAGLFLTAEDDSKNKYLSALKYAGKLEKENSKDPYFDEIGKFYSNLPKEKFSELQFAQTSINKGYKFCRDVKYELAVKEFSDARTAFEKSGDKLEAKLAEYWIGYANFQLTNTEESFAIFEDLNNFTEKRNYKWLQSNVLSKLADHSYGQNNHSKSIEYGKKSLKLATETSDLYLKQKALAQIANQYQSLGRYKEAFVYIQQSFEILDSPETSSRQKHRTFDQSVRALLAQKYYATAASLIKESITLNAEENKDAVFTYRDYLLLGRIYGQLGNYEEAFKFARQGIEAAGKIDDEKARNKGKSATLLNLGQLQKQSGDCQSAIKSYNAAIELLISAKFSSYDYEARKNRLFCYFQLGDKSSVEAELPNVLSTFETNREEILDEQNRNAFFDSENDIYDLAVAYEFDNKNYEKAFNYSEESRSRSLLDLQKNGAKIAFDESEPEVIFDGKSAKPRNLAEIQAAMPDGTQISEYTILSDKVLIWLITKNNLKQFSVEIARDDLEKKISSFTEAIQNKETEKQIELARELYKILISPLENNLDNAKEICLIPDKFLFKIPFAALISRKTGNFLFADYKLLVSPSANVFLNSTENAEKRNYEKPEKLLSVGNPMLDKQEFSDLQELTAAKNEAKEVASFYEHPTVLLEEDATKQKVQTAISETDVFHFAGHYVVDEQTPLLSGFPLAGTGRDNKLTNYELLEGRFQKPKLIVLSACQTGVEDYYKGEGMIGAGRTFLASGIPLVVGSLWQVDSDATAELMKKFHYYRKKKNLSTVPALQQAQLEMLNSPDEKFRSVFNWAGFLVVGGHAQF